MKARLKDFDAREVRLRDAREHVRIHLKRMFTEWEGQPRILLYEVMSYTMGAMFRTNRLKASADVQEVMASLCRKREIY
ncbi:hypothetical protein [Methylobacterium sp. CM6247]